MLLNNYNMSYAQIMFVRIYDNMEIIHYDISRHIHGDYMADRMFDAFLGSIRGTTVTNPYDQAYDWLTTSEKYQRDGNWKEAENYIVKAQSQLVQAGINEGYEIPYYKRYI